MQTVYVDILIMTNFIVDYFLLLLTAFLSGNEKKRLRLFFSSFLASLSSLLIFAPEMSFAAEFSSKFIISLVIVYIAFGFKNKIRFLKSLVIFYAANVVLAGGTVTVWSIFKPRGLVVRNGAVFYNISPLILVLSTSVVYVLSLIISRIISSRKVKGKEYSIKLIFNSKTVTLTGFVDSGNMLSDTISQTPVIVCDYNKIKPLLDEKMNKIFSKENFEMGFYEDIINSGFAEKFRVIPFDSLGSSGVMAALTLDGAVIYDEKGNREIKDVIMAVTHKKIADGEFDVLLNPELVTV